MFKLIAERLEEAPGIIPLAILSPILLLLTVVLIACVLSRRNGLERDADARLSVWPELIAIAAIVAPILAIDSAWRLASGGIVNALTLAEPSDKATILAAAISNQMNADVFVSIQLLTTGSLAAVALGLLVALRASGLAGVGAGLAALSVPVLLTGVMMRASALIAAFSAVAVADPAQKAELLMAAVDESRPLLTGGAIAAAACLATGAVASVLALAKRPSRPARPWPALALIAVSLALSLGLFLEVRPFAEENALPLRFSASGNPLPVIAGVTPVDLEGPNPVARAPVLALGSAVLSLEGIAIDGLGGLAAKLEEMKKIELLMHPDSPFRGVLLVVVDEGVAAERLLVVMEAAAPVGYSTVDLAFVKRGELQERPLFGRRQSQHTTAARVVMGVGADGATTLEVAPEEPFAKLAARIVDASRRGDVHLVRRP